MSAEDLTRFTLRLSAEEKRLVELYAMHYKISINDAIRESIRVHFGGTVSLSAVCKTTKRDSSPNQIT